MIQHVYAVIQATDDEERDAWIRVEARINVPDIAASVQVEDVAEMFHASLREQFRHRPDARLVHVWMSTSREPFSVRRIASRAIACAMRFVLGTQAMVVNNKFPRRSDVIN